MGRCPAVPKLPPSSPGDEDPAPRDDLTQKKVFTTGEAAAACGLSQQTIIRCFDSGRLTGFKVPGSKFRRIPREYLIRFMLANSIALNNIESARKRILAVDDNTAMLEAYRDAFARGDRFDFKAAANGYDAGLLTESFRPHVLLLDYKLPDIDGLAVCRRIRATPHLNATRILCVSGMADQDAAKALAAAGADGFLSKPFDEAVLLQRVDDLIGVESTVTDHK